MVLLGFIFAMNMKKDVILRLSDEEPFGGGAKIGEIRRAGSGAVRRTRCARGVCPGSRVRGLPVS